MVAAGYYANNLNQITNRDVPAFVDILGASLATTVNVNGTNAYRKGEYFWDELPVNNTNSPLWTNIIVAASGQTSVTGNVFVAQEPETFKYDADGNLTNDGRWAYTWDGENRLIQMTVNTNVGPQYQLNFSYDYQGRRIQKMVSTNSVGIYTNKFLYDGWNLVAEVQPNNSLVRSYMWGTDLSGSMQGAGGVGGLLEVSYSGTNCFLAFDGNGNVAALINAADGTAVANYDYGPFGEVIRNTGPMGKVNPIRFSTKYDDDESDLLYYGYRYYKPSTGTWPNRDPIGERGGLNQYAFIYNNLVNLVDGSGLEQVLIWVSAYIPEARFQFIYPDGFDPDAIFSGDGRTGPQIGGSSRAFHKLIIETDPDKSPIVMNTAGGNISTVYYKPGGGFPKLFFLSAIDAAPPYATVTRIKTGIDTITKVQIHAATSDPLISRFIQAPELHYDYTLDFTSCSKKLLVRGSHGHYPAFDMIIDTTAGQKTLLDYTPKGFDNGPWALKFAPMNVYLPLMDY